MVEDEQCRNCSVSFCLLDIMMVRYKVITEEVRKKVWVLERKVRVSIHARVEEPGPSGFRTWTTGQSQEIYFLLHYPVTHTQSHAHTCEEELKYHLNEITLAIITCDISGIFWSILSPVISSHPILFCLFVLERLNVLHLFTMVFGVQPEASICLGCIRCFLLSAMGLLNHLCLELGENTINYSDAWY